MTFGKGAIQQVVPLGGSDAPLPRWAWRRGGGSEGTTRGADGALMLTVARYTTPAGAPINGVGLRPARACRAGRLPPAIPALRGHAAALPGAHEALASALGADPCLRVAAGVLAARL